MGVDRSNDEKVVLRKRANAALQRLHALEDAERYETVKALKGKCFQYRNSYGATTEADRWWLYSRVLEVAKDGWLTLFTFETDKYGEVTVHPEKKRMHESSLGEPITLRQFQQAWKVTAARINRTAKAAGALR